jgi:hypothetical protein
MTLAHPDPPYDRGAVPGAARAPVVFRRAAIKRAVGLVKAYRSHLARWERQGRQGRMPEAPAVERLPVTASQGVGLIARTPQWSYRKVRLGNRTDWTGVAIPVCIPRRAAGLLTGSDEARARIEAAPSESRALERGGRTEEAQAVQERLKPRPWAIAQASATLYRHPDGWATHVPVVRAVPVKKAEEQCEANPGLPVTTVDRGRATSLSRLHGRDESSRARCSSPAVRTRPGAGGGWRRSAGGHRHREGPRAGCGRTGGAGPGWPTPKRTPPARRRATSWTSPSSLVPR